MALELAQQLTAQDQEVKLLILLDPTIPTNCRTEAAVGSAEAALPKSIQRVRIHFSKLRLLSGREKIAYVSKRINWRFDLIKRHAKMMACQAFLVLGRRLPERFRRFYFLELSCRATQDYVARPYGLPAALLRTEERAGLDWGHALIGPIEFYDMPGRHLDVIRGPYVNTWAQRVRACLQNAEKN